ncbi:MAG: hypothetical protein NW208_12475 [Bryobacter sp.]|nr:hypothetical protein [Bryobacter sp.]
MRLFFALFILAIQLWSQRNSPVLIERVFTENALRFAAQPKAPGEYQVSDREYSFLVDQSSVNAIRFQYTSACQPEAARLQEFLRNSGVVKAYELRPGKLVLEAQLLKNPPLTAPAISAFLVQFRQMLELYRGSAERFCVIAPKVLEELTEVPATHGKFSMKLNLAEWTQTPGRSENIKQFGHRSGELFVILISERASFPLESLRGIALGNAKNVDPAAKIVKEETVRLSGRDVLALEIAGKVQGIDFRYLGRYYAGSSGTVQLVAFTMADRLADLRPLMEGVLGSLELRDDAKAGNYQVSSSPGKNVHPINNGRAVLEFDPEKWSIGKNEGGRTEWNEKAGRALTIVIHEPTSFKSEDLAEIAIENLKEAASEYNVKTVGPGKLNGLDMTCVEADVTVNKIPFAYRGCFRGGNKEAYQFVSMTIREHAEDVKPVLEEFWSGLRFVTVLYSGTPAAVK